MTFVSVFEIVARAGYEKDIATSAAEMSTLFKERFGSLGSRLHQTVDGRFFAYAAWPDRKTWEGRSAAVEAAPALYKNFDRAIKMTKIIFETDDIIFSNLERISEDLAP